MALFLCTPIFYAQFKGEALGAIRNDHTFSSHWFSRLWEQVYLCQSTVLPRQETMEADPAALGRAIRWTKSLFLLVLLLSTTTIAYSVYKLLRSAEESKFNESYAQLEGKMYEAISASTTQVIGSIDALVFDAESQVNHSEDEEWPYVTIPHFAKRAAKFLKLTRMLQITLAMYITKEQRSEWESYTAQHGDWVSTTPLVYASPLTMFV